jgi:hypothetical protein
MQRTKMSATLIFAGALLLSGCAAGGGNGDSTGGDACETVRTEVRDISNGAQNVLAAGGDPTEIQSALKDYSERAAALGEENDTVTGPAETLVGALDEAAAFAETLPTDPEAEVDAEAVAEHQTAIQEAAVKVTSTCADAKG